MNVVLQSLDRDVQGSLRHQLLRAFMASLVVLVVFGFLLLLAQSSLLQMVRPGGAEELSIMSRLSIWFAAIVVGVVIAVFFFLGLTIIGIEMVASILRLFPRRAVAVALLVFYPMLGIILGLALMGELLTAIGLSPAEKSVTPMEGVGLGWLFLCGLCLIFELSMEAWWRLKTQRDVFDAARGWRPRGFRILERFQTHLGLPVFLSNFGRGRTGLAGLYFLIAVLNTSVPTLPIVPLMVIGMSRNATNLQMGIPIVALLLLNLLGTGRFLARATEKRATQIYQDVRIWDSRAPIIFLRAFAQDDDLLAVGTRDPLLKLTAGVAEPRTLDELLLEHASPYGPVLAIGDPAHKIPPLGAARIFVQGGNWQEIVTSLTQAARAVVMCPGQSQGVGWELELISGSGKTSNTIFLANPEESRDVTVSLFARVAGKSLEIETTQIPVAMFFDPAVGCRVFTAMSLSVTAFSLALSLALQTLFGLEGFPSRKPSFAVNLVGRGSGGWIGVNLAKRK